MMTSAPSQVGTPVSRRPRPAPARARRGLAAAVGAALLMQTAMPAVAQVERLPDLGSADTAELSGPQEQALGASIMRELRASGVVYDDAELADWLNRFGRRLTITSPARGRAFEFFPVQDASINAFALPGGYIGVHTGLLATAATESELASVLGHEIGHVTQHHIARMLRNQKNANLLAMAGMVLGALAMRGNPDAGVGAIALSSDLATRSILSFSRDAEREADRLGLEMLREGGFDVGGAPQFFGRLQQQSRFSEGELHAYLRTHPVTAERINDLNLRIQQLKDKAPKRPDSLEFRLLRARARALSAQSVDRQNEAQKQFDAELKTEAGSKDVALWFGLASLAYVRGDWAAAGKALDQVDRLLEKPHPFVARLRIANQLRAGNLEDALKRSADSLKQFANARALVRQRAEVLNAARQWDAAIALLRDQTRIYKSDAELWRLLGEAYLAKGEKGMSHLAAAEGYLVLGYLHPALEQLRLARKAGDLDYYNGSIADARLKETEAAWLQEQKDAGRPVPASSRLQGASEPAP